VALLLLDLPWKLLLLLELLLFVSLLLALPVRFGALYADVARILHDKLRTFKECCL
jgi:hypothetical protein